MRNGWWGCFGEYGCGVSHFGNIHYKWCFNSKQYEKINCKTEDLRPSECIQEYPLEEKIPIELIEYFKTNNLLPPYVK